MATKDAQILRRQINKRLQTLVNQTNMDILQMFKGVGINYVPFQLTYNEYEVKTDQGGRRPVKNVTLDIDPDFLEKLFEDKIGFQTWLSRHYPKIARQHWKAVNLGHEEPNLTGLKKKFHKEQGINAKPEIQKNKKSKGGRINQKKSTIVGYVREKANPDTPEERLFESFTGRDVEKFMEDEDFIFKGNLKTYFKNTSDTRVNKVLTDALKQFNDAFQNMPLDLEDNSPDANELGYQEWLVEKRKGESKENDVRLNTIQHEKFLSEISGMKEQWKVKPRFPNIRNIRDWFVRTGIYNSYKLDQFREIKTVKGRMNWIDRSVFLIANGVYANTLGQRTASWSGKYKQSAGAKIPISKARKYKKPSADREKYQTERQAKYEQWNIDNRKLARGWKNSGATYSRVNRKRGNSRAQADSRRDKRNE